MCVCLRKKFMSKKSEQKSKKTPKVLASCKLDAKARARGLLPTVMDALEDELRHGEGNSRTKAAEIINKIAAVDEEIDTKDVFNLAWFEINQDDDGNIIVYAPPGPDAPIKPNANIDKQEDSGTNDKSIRN